MSNSKDSSRQKHSKGHKKSGTVVAQTLPGRRASNFSKAHEGYWKTRVVRRTFKGRDGTEQEAPDYSIRIKFNDRREWFNLHTPNAATAAAKARDIWLSLVSSGWEPTLALYKPQSEEKTRVCTVGEFLSEIENRHTLAPATLHLYAQRLRRIVSDIAKLEDKMNKQARLAKYDYVNGGNATRTAKIDKQSLDILTPESINEWRKSYIDRKGSNPLKRKSAERSAASYLRCAKSLFSPNITKELPLLLPPNPFIEIRIKDPGAQRYHSDINPDWLIVQAWDELKTDAPQAFLAFLLCLYGGLRRKEADNLPWDQVDQENAQIQVRRTEFFSPKTEESVRNIDIPKEIIGLIWSYKGKSRFVLDGGEPNPNATYHYYRSDHTWRQLNKWLKQKGVKDPKAIHSLRKESGSLIASIAGIEAARQHLGHRSIKTTSAHYTEKRKRVEVPSPGFINTSTQNIEKNV